MAERHPLEAAVEFADNAEPRCPVVLLLDTSGSMDGERINALNAGLRTFRHEVKRDRLAARRVEIAIVLFNSEVRVAHEFSTVDSFKPPALSASGETHMAAGIERALDLVERRKRTYRHHGIVFYRPWIFMITDGEPEGETENAVAHATRRLREAEAHKRVAFFA